MTLLLTVTSFALGAIVASFIGVLVGRYGTGQSILYGRSKCDVCGESLSSFTLVPIFSYVLLRGRARCCGARLSPLSTIAEGTLGVCFALAYSMLGLTFVLPVYFVAFAILLAIVEYDLLHQIIPPTFLAVFVPVAALAGALTAHSVHAFLVSLLVAGVFALFFAALHFFSGGRYMGLADTPLVFALALMTGAAAIPGFIFSFWIGAVIGIGLLLGRPRESRMGVEVPLAPFLAAGFLLAYFTSWNPFAFMILIAYL